MRHERTCNYDVSSTSGSRLKRPRDPDTITPSRLKIVKTKTAFANASITWKLKFPKNNGDGYMDLVSASTIAMKGNVDRYCRQRHALKFNMSLHIKFEKAADSSVVTNFNQCLLDR